MLNKKNLIKLSLWVMAMGVLCLPMMSSADNLLNIIGKININTKNISPVHFADNENNFWWFIYISHSSDVNIQWEWEHNVEVPGNTWYKCNDMVQWFYYDSQRWERLWPLDVKTQNVFGMSDLYIDGWIYTRCVMSWYDVALEKCENEDDIDECIRSVKKEFSDEYGYYGYIKHKYKKMEYDLLAWVSYKTGDWIEMDPSKWLASTFVRYNNQYPLWFIYDKNGGVWFVWCKVNSGLSLLVENIQWWSNLLDFFNLNDGIIRVQNLDNVNFNCSPWSAKNSLIKLVVEWIVWMSSDTSNWLENNSEAKTQLFNTSSVNNATVINKVKQKAETLCRGKWRTSEPSNVNSIKDSIICLDMNNNINVNADKYLWKTLIVKWGAGVNVSPVSKNNLNTKIYDIFVDGDLYINDYYNTDSDNLFVINKNWFVKQDSNAANLINNYKWNENWCGENYAWVAYVIKGNIIVNGNVKVSYYNHPSLENKYFVYGKLMSKDTEKSLLEVFTWSCDGYNQKSSDWYCCPESRYQGAALSIIDQNFSSPLL